MTETKNPLGLIPGRVYTVVPVRCTEKTCIGYSECSIEAGAVGLLDEQNTQDMICHDYATNKNRTPRDKRVTWERVS